MHQFDYLISEVEKALRFDLDTKKEFWKNSDNEGLMSCLTEYKKGSDQKGRIKEFCSNLARTTVPSSSEEQKEWHNFKDAVKRIAGNEDILLANDDTMQDHLTHVFNVFLTGYLIINKAKKFFTNDIIFNNLNKIFEVKSRNKEEFFTYLNYTWFYAAFMHDVGYPLEKFAMFDETIDKVCAFFEVGYSAKVKPPDVKAFIDSSKDEIDIILDIFKQQDYQFEFDHAKLIDFIRYRIDGKERDDHAVIGGVSLLKKFSKDSPVVRYAAYSIFFHNFKHKFNNQGEKIPFKLSFLKDPIPILLIICDEAQRWKREREIHTFNKLYDRVELQSIEISAYEECLGVSMFLNYITSQEERKKALEDALGEELYEKSQKLLISHLEIQDACFEIHPRINNTRIVESIMLGIPREKVLSQKPSLCQAKVKCPLGVTNFFDRTEKTVTDSLTEARESFEWFGLSGNNVVKPNNIELIIKKTNNDVTPVTYTFYTLKPKCKDIMKDFDKWRNKPYIPKACEAITKGIRGIEDLRTSVGKKANINQLFYEKFPKMRIVMVDNKKIYLSYYEKGEHAMNCPQILIEKSENAILFDWFKWYLEKTKWEIKRGELIKKILKIRVEQGESLSKIFDNVTDKGEEISNISKEIGIKVDKDYIKEILEEFELDYK